MSEWGSVCPAHVMFVVCHLAGENHCIISYSHFNKSSHLIKGAVNDSKAKHDL